MDERDPTLGDEQAQESVNESRRAFLNVYGKAALVAPPVVTALLATSMSSPAIAASTGGKSGSGGGGGSGPLGLALVGAQAGVVAALPGQQRVVTPVQQSLPVAAAPPPPTIDIPPAPPPAAPGPERG